MCCRQRRTQRSKRAGPGFSLLEVMLVLVIIGLIAGMITANIPAWMTMAKRSRAKGDIGTLVDAVEAFCLTKGRYPTNDEGLEVLTEPLNGGPVLLKSLPKDPWKQPYVYITPGMDQPFDVLSYGADKQEGGVGADADIICWKLDDNEEK